MLILQEILVYSQTKMKLTKLLNDQCYEFLSLSQRKGYQFANLCLTVKLNITYSNLQQSSKEILNYSNLKLQQLWFTPQNKQPTKKRTYLPNEYAQSILVTLFYI